VEFVATGDCKQTRELVAAIRGSDGGGACMAWNKLVAVAREDDHEAILNHALLQKPTALPDVS